MQKTDMLELVKSFFEIYKTGIDLFRVIMNALNPCFYKGSKCTEMVCCAVI